MVRALILLFVVLFSVYLTEQAYFLEDDYINKINEGASTWKAGVNFHRDTPLDYFYNLLGSPDGVQIPTADNSHMYKTHDISYEKIKKRIPRHFDAREKWRQCTNIGSSIDQGNCGSCWAVSTTSAFADRLCIATNGTFNQLISIENLAFCCSYCGHGCRGGWAIRAWNYFKNEGVVTGGDYNTTDGCAPYGISSCPYDENKKNTCANKPNEINHVCQNSCYGNTKLNYKKDLKYTKDAYFLNYSSIQKDIMTYGPIEASFKVYSDFFSYKSGVYIKSKNVTYMGGHAVKLIGWGREHGVPYWLLVNSWNEDWGLNGTFKIRRGTNECGIDNSTTAGVPLIF